MMNVIYNLEEFQPLKKGWTYILISHDKNYLKIGKTTADLENRIKNINNDQNYKQYQFRLLMAIRGANYEYILHSLFSDYRACYFWVYDKEKSKPLTLKESKRKVRSELTRIDLDAQNPDRIVVYRNLIQTTRLELFKIPPRKVAPNVINIVLEYLDIKR